MFVKGRPRNWIDLVVPSTVWFRVRDYGLTWVVEGLCLYSLVGVELLHLNKRAWSDFA